MNDDATVTVTLTAAQHRLLRDLVHWAAVDIRVGPEETFWAYIVPDEPDDWDAAVATMQEIENVFNPPESLAGGARADTPPTD